MASTEDLYETIVPSRVEKKKQGSAELGRKCESLNKENYSGVIGKYFEKLFFTFFFLIKGNITRNWKFALPELKIQLAHL